MLGVTDETFDLIERELECHPFARTLGSGAYGDVYRTDKGLALKVTTDDTEAPLARLIMDMQELGEAPYVNAFPVVHDAFLVEDGEVGLLGVILREELPLDVKVTPATKAIASASRWTAVEGTADAWSHFRSVLRGLAKEPGKKKLGPALHALAEDGVFLLDLDVFDNLRARRTGQVLVCDWGQNSAEDTVLRESSWPRAINPPRTLRRRR